MTNKIQNWVLFGVYAIANALILLVHGVFWDDLTILNASKEAILEQYIGNGMPWTGYLHCFMQQLPHTVLLYHALLFGIGLANVYLFKAILKHMPLSASTQWYATLLFAAYPLGVAHMAMICFSYNLGFMLELIAILLLQRNQPKFNVLRYALFFVVQFLASMFLPSTIVLIFGAILLAAYLNTREHAEKSWAYAKEWVVKALKMVVYFVPCLVFWVIKQLYAQPIGNYAAGEYNSFSLRKTLGYPKSLLDSVLNTVDYWIDNASAVCGSIVTAIVFAVLTYAIYRVIKNRKEDNQEERFVPILIGGAWMFVCGITAYNLIGDVPMYGTMEDRHAILLQAVAPILLCALVGTAVKREQMRKLVFSGIAAVFMVGAISQYCLAIEESQKNDAVSQYFASHELNPGTVWVIDKHDPMEATRFYTYSGLYYRATGKQNHCFIVNDNSGVDAALLTPEYNQAEAQIAEISNFIIVEPAEYGLSKMVFFNMKDYYLNKRKYNERVQRTFVVSEQELCTINQE